MLSYLHGDHLGSRVATSNSSSNFSGQEWYHAYGRYRGGHELGSENRFTGQKLDATGLMYYNAHLGLKPQTNRPSPALHGWAATTGVKVACMALTKTARLAEPTGGQCLARGLMV